MSKNETLTDKDSFKLSTETKVFLDNYTGASGKLGKDIKILDYGHGRGRTVASLHRMGYSAYGLESYMIPNYNGLSYFENILDNPQGSGPQD